MYVTLFKKAIMTKLMLLWQLHKNLWKGFVISLSPGIMIINDGKWNMLVSIHKFFLCKHFLEELSHMTWWVSESPTTKCWQNQRVMTMVYPCSQHTPDLFFCFLCNLWDKLLLVLCKRWTAVSRQSKKWHGDWVTEKRISFCFCCSYDEHICWVHAWKFWKSVGPFSFRVKLFVRVS